MTGVTRHEQAALRYMRDQAAANTQHANPLIQADGSNTIWLLNIIERLEPWSTHSPPPAQGCMQCPVEAHEDCPRCGSKYPYHKVTFDGGGVGLRCRACGNEWEEPS